MLVARVFVLHQASALAGMMWRHMMLNGPDKIQVPWGLDVATRRRLSQASQTSQTSQTSSQAEDGGALDAAVLTPAAAMGINRAPAPGGHLAHHPRESLGDL